jgi:hypothetical protein
VGEGGGDRVGPESDCREPVGDFQEDELGRDETTPLGGHLSGAYPFERAMSQGEYASRTRPPERCPASGRDRHYV